MWEAVYDGAHFLLPGSSRPEQARQIVISAQLPVTLAYQLVRRASL